MSKSLRAVKEPGPGRNVPGPNAGWRKMGCWVWMCSVMRGEVFVGVTC